MLLEPARQLGPHDREVLGAVAQQRRHHLHRVGARHHRLEGVEAGVDAAAGRERGPHAAVQDREPAQPEQQLGGVGEVERRHDLERLGVDVGLVEAVEEDEAVGAERVERVRQVRAATRRTATA